MSHEGPEPRDEGEFFLFFESALATDGLVVVLYHGPCKKQWVPNPKQDLSEWDGGRCPVRHPSPPSGFHYPRHTLDTVDTIQVPIPAYTFVDDIFPKSD